MEKMQHEIRDEMRNRFMRSKEQQDKKQFRKLFPKRAQAMSQEAPKNIISIDMKRVEF